MNKNLIFETSLVGYKPIIWYGELLISRFSQIQDVLREKLGEEYAHLLAEPTMNPAQAEVTWLSPVMSASSVNLESLPAQEQNQIREKLARMLAKIRALAEELKAIPNYEQLGEILEICTEIPSTDCVKVDGEKIAMVMWGFYGDNQGFRIRDNLQKIPVVTSEATKEEPAKEQTEKKQDPPIETPPQKKEDKTGKKPVNYWKWLALLCLLFLIGLFIWWLFGEDDTKDKGKKYLPKEEGKLPKLDTSKIIKDPKDPYKREIISNRLNIRLSKGTNSEEFAQKFKEKYTSEDIKIVSYLKKYGILQIEFPEKDRETLKKEFKTFKEVRAVFEESVFDAKKKPSDPDFESKESSWYFDYIKVYDAWNTSMGNANIIVAVIDDGFDLEHPELKGKIVKPWNIADNDSNVNTANGKKSHGTHVASTIVGKADNNSGVAGIAPNCSLMPLQVADNNGKIQGLAVFYAISQAIHQNAHVINISLGMIAGITPEEASKIPLDKQVEASKESGIEKASLYADIFEEAYANGIVVVQAAGNSNLLAGIDPMKRSNHTTIVVGAATPKQERASFSSFGEEVELSAPGVHIYNAVPNNKYQYMDGTSMASPIVAGAAALLKSINPDLTPAQIKDFLIETGLPLKDNNGMRRMGPIIQLGDAVEKAKKSRKDANLQPKIDSLERVIRDCTEGRSKKKEEELVIPCDSKDIKFAVGRWKATETLYNTRTKESISLIFDIDADGTGLLTLRERNGAICKAKLKVQIKSGLLIIDQLESAACDKGEGYEAYVFQFSPDCNTAAKCLAKRKSKGDNEFGFYLKKL